MTELKVPLLPDEAEKVEVIAIYCKEGERVEHDQNLMDIETDKVVLEIFAPQDGVITAIKVKVGDKVAQEETLCVLNPDKDTYQEDVDHIQALFDAELGEENSVDTDSPDIQESISAIEAEKQQAENSEQCDAAEIAADEAEPEQEPEPEPEPTLEVEKAEVEHFIGQEVFDSEETERSDAEGQDTRGQGIALPNVEPTNSEVESTEAESTDIEITDIEKAEAIETQAQIDEVNKSSAKQKVIAASQIKEAEKENKVDGFLVFIVMLGIVGFGAYAFDYFDLAAVLKELFERVM